jgi:F-type H+-transporting ATPase subunit b
MRVLNRVGGSPPRQVTPGSELRPSGGGCSLRLMKSPKRFSTRGMKRAGIMLLGFGLSAATLLAQEEGHVEKGASGLPTTTETILLWANFALLAVGLGYLIKKYGAPFFAARSERIQREIVEAAKVKQDAETRSAEVDRRLANLETDMTALRAESRQELASLERNAAAKTSAEIAKIQSNAEQEIAAAGKAARLQLKRYSAELAVQLAGQKIRARMTPDAQDALVGDFVQQLDGSAARAQAN